MTRVAVTGHRPERLPDGGEKVMRLIKAWMEARPKVTEYNIGGARGVDTWAGFSAMGLSKKIHVYLPFPYDTFTKKWFDRKDRERLQKMIKYSSSYRHLSKVYDVTAYILRDHAMVDEADEVLSVWDGVHNGGTWHTVSYAIGSGKRVNNINPLTGKAEIIKL